MLCPQQNEGEPLIHVNSAAGGLIGPEAA